MPDNVTDCYHCSCAEQDGTCCDCGVNPALESLQREYDLLRNVHENVKSHYIKRTEHLAEVNQTLRSDLEELRELASDFVHGEDHDLLAGGYEGLWMALNPGKEPYGD